MVNIFWKRPILNTVLHTDQSRNKPM